MHQGEHTYLTALQLKNKIQLETMDLNLQIATARGRKEIWFQRWDLASPWMHGADYTRQGRLNWIFNKHRVLNSLVLELHTISSSCCPQLMSPELKWQPKSNCGLGSTHLSLIICWLGWAATCHKTWLWFSLVRKQIWKPLKEKSVWIVMCSLAFHSLLFRLCVCVFVCTLRCCYSTNQSKCCLL